MEIESYRLDFYKRVSEARFMRKKNKQTNHIGEEALYIREGEEPREKKKKKKKRKREKIETGVGGFEVSAWDHGWVGWLQIKVGHAAARAQLRPGSCAGLGREQTWVTLRPRSRTVVR